MVIPLPPEVLFLLGAVRRVLPMPYRETDRKDRFAMAIKERRASFTASASGNACITLENPCRFPPQVIPSLYFSQTDDTNIYINCLLFSFSNPFFLSFSNFCKLTGSHSTAERMTSDPDESLIIFR
jgi:hypothetical protein